MFWFSQARLSPITIFQAVLLKIVKALIYLYLNSISVADCLGQGMCKISLKRLGLVASEGSVKESAGHARGAQSQLGGPSWSKDGNTGIIKTVSAADK